MNYLIGSIKHCEKNRIEAWVKSALKNCECEIVLLVLDEKIPESILDLEKIGVNIVHTPTGNETDINICKWERHIKVRNFLKTLKDDDVVILTDTLDVIFQKDAFEWFKKNAKKDIVLTSEGIEHKDEPWNMQSILTDHTEFSDEIKFNEVINSGVILGKPKSVSNLLLHIFTSTKGLNPESADQPALNVALLSSFIKDNIQIVNSDDNLAIHCAVAGPTNLFYDWGFVNSYKYGLPILIDEIIINEKTKEPFCIVHQYNRVKEWEHFLKNKYEKYEPKLIKNNINNTAIVVCSRSNSSYFTDWSNILSFKDNQYMLCDVSNKDIPPVDFILKFNQENFITYTLDNIRNTFSFYKDPSNKHWWNTGGNRNIIWFYPHFRMLYFYKINPNYDYYWFFDEDITFPQNEFDKFINEHSFLDHDCMITYLFGNLNQIVQRDTLEMDYNMGSYHNHDYHWLNHYPGDGDKQPEDLNETYGSYFPIVRLSNKAMKILLKEHENGFCGYSEGYVPSILNYNKLSLYSIYGKDSKIKVNPNIIIHHRRYLELEWKNV